MTLTSAGLSYFMAS